VAAELVESGRRYPERVVDDRYELIETIGSGGMAVVWKARDRTLDRPVAIKRLLPHLGSDPAEAARFRREARAAAALRHPGIVTVYDTGEDDEGPYIVLELVEGRTLDDRLRSEGRLDPPEVAAMMRSVAAALDHAHAEGVVHRDIKPSNLMVDDDGGVRITDFGIAKTLEDPTEVTTEEELIGTIAYMAPEILDGEPASPASDIYSLAAVTQVLLTGAPPFQTDHIGAMAAAIRAGDRAVMEDVPAGMADMVRQAMSPKPADRPGSAGAFAAGLVASTTLPIPLTPAVPTSRAGSDEPTLVMAGAARPDSDHNGRRGLPVLLGVSVIGAGLLIWAALAREAPSEAADASLPAGAETTTTMNPTTSTTTTTTTTTVPPTVADTPESIATAIFAALAEMRPPEFHPRDVNRIDDALRKTLEEWAEGDLKKAEKELEKLAERVDDLPDSDERDALVVLVLDLAEAMGFDVSDEFDDD
jgi:eukaryotic-like serine/threonine-protein kinase